MYERARARRRPSTAKVTKATQVLTRVRARARATIGDTSRELYGLFAKQISGKNRSRARHQANAARSLMRSRFSTGGVVSIVSFLALSHGERERKFWVAVCMQNLRFLVASALPARCLPIQEGDFSAHYEIHGRPTDLLPYRASMKIASARSTWRTLTNFASL